MGTRMQIPFAKESSKLTIDRPPHECAEREKRSNSFQDLLPSKIPTEIDVKE